MKAKIEFLAKMVLMGKISIDIIPEKYLDGVTAYISNIQQTET